MSWRGSAARCCAAAQLKDHRIVTTHDTGEAGGSHFLVMEFVEGSSLGPDRFQEGATAGNEGVPDYTTGGPRASARRR